jgi:transglutaminase-like putative cysteine protease
MLKFKNLFYIFLVIFTIQIIFAEDLNEFDEITIKISNQINFDVELEEESRIEYFIVESYIKPQEIESKQEVISISSNKEYQIFNLNGSHFLKFEYNDNQLSPKNMIKNEFIIKNKFYENKITKKVKFPLENTPENLSVFLQFDEYINIDDNIQNQASKLAIGEDDLFKLAVKIGDWVINDIKYNISTISENPNQNSAQVFQSKKGVCREITNLYVSMMRSLGIPTRIALGYAYTEDQEIVNFVNSNWGGHVWAEVYINDSWIPFDLTYNQYGSLDPTHIIIDRGPNINNRILYIKTNSSGLDIKNRTVETNFEIIDKKKIEKNQGININITGPRNLGFDSYGYLKVNIENQNNYYKVLFLNFAKVDEIDFIKENKKIFILAPKENLTYNIPYKIPILNENFEYTMPFLIYNQFINETFSIIVNSQNDIIDLENIPDNKEKKTNFSKNKIQLECSYDFGLPDNILLCKFFNPNNFISENISFCLDNICNEFSLRVNEKKQIKFFSKENVVEPQFIISGKKTKIELGLKKPFIIYEKNTNKSDFNFNYQIENYNENLRIRLLLNDEQIDTIINPKGNLSYKIPYGENQIKIELLYESQIIQEELFNVINTQRNFNNFWERIIQLFKIF